MNPKLQPLVLAVAVALTIGAAGSAQAISPATEYTSASTLFDFLPFTLGYQFSLSSAVAVDALGYWYDGLGNSHLVGIWDSSNTLVVSTTVLGSDPDVGHFLWDSISPVILNAGVYTIGGEFLGNDNEFPTGASGVTSISEFTWVQDMQVFGSGLNQPTVSTFGDYGNGGIMLANFSVNIIPEPETYALLLAGLGLLGFAARRRKQREAVAA